MASITVIGGSGYAGSAIVAEAAARGHQVTSISRSIPADKVDGVNYSQGDLSTEVPDLSGTDVVVAALSPRGDNEGALRPAYDKLAKAAAQANVRFVAVGGFSSLRPADGAPRFAEGDGLPPEFAAEALEMNAILGDLTEAGDAVDWLFVSPAANFGSFNPGEKRGTYRVSNDVALFDENEQSDISGADFALAVVDEIEKPTVRSGHISFAY